MIWEWIRKFFGFGQSANVPPNISSRFHTGEVVWALYLPDGEYQDGLRRLDRVPILKQFSVGTVVPVIARTGFSHFVYELHAANLKIRLHESYVSATPIEAIDHMPVEYLN